MDLLEHQAKALLRKYGIRTPRGRLATSAPEAHSAATQLACPCVVKAQVPVGGRGKAGGVLAVEDAGTAAIVAQRILAMRIGDYPVESVLIEEALPHAQEYYAAICIERAEGRPLLLLSTCGGMDIEQVSREQPAALAKVPIDPLYGWSDYLARKACFALGLEAETRKALAPLLERLWEAFADNDASLVEINPLVVIAGEAVALDAKLSIDDSALYRHPELAGRFVRSADRLERLAAEKGLPYVRLADGDIGVLGNGAGLTMSSLDVLAGAGGRPADFLDIGGGASAERIVDALTIVLADERIRAVFIDVFGGITRCDEVARGLLAAYGSLSPQVPFVVRLAGTNAAEGLALLAEAKLPGLIVEESMTAAARLAVSAASGGALTCPS